MTYDEALTYLDSFVNYERARDSQAMREVKLERMRQLCRQLGDPQRRFRSVLVTGTNGKGSICAMLYSMLQESILRVGLYTSPHLEDVRERIRVWTLGPTNGPRPYGQDWIQPEEVAVIVTQLMPLLERLRRDATYGPPTYFEVMTAIAFEHFRKRQVEIAVLEVGLGGRLDATNVVDQAVSVIGPIAIDHTEVLGTAPTTIAQEKAGIIKPNQTVLTALPSEEVLQVLRTACDAHGVPLVTGDSDVTARIHAADLDGLQLSITGLRGIYEDLELPLLGRHQALNAALAVGALEALSPTGIPHSLVANGLAKVEWPGRFEVVHEQPSVIMDGAHNAHAAQALRATLEELYPGRRIHCLIGMSSDKSMDALGQVLGPIAASATCTQSRHARALDPTALAQRLSAFVSDVHVMSDAVDAYTYLLNAVSDDEVIVVTGSLFLVGELRAALRYAHVLSPRARRRAADVPA